METRPETKRGIWVFFFSDCRHRAARPKVSPFPLFFFSSLSPITFHRQSDGFRPASHRSLFSAARSRKKNLLFSGDFVGILRISPPVSGCSPSGYSFRFPTEGGLRNRFRSASFSTIQSFGVRVSGFCSAIPPCRGVLGTNLTGRSTALGI